MIDENEVDIALTSDGDLDLWEYDSNTCDVNNVEKLEYIKQQVTIRIKTMNPDWFYDKIGSDLEELLGKVNSKETAQQGIEKIRSCLVYDSFLSNDDIYIKPVPVDYETVSYFVFVKTTFKNEPVAFVVNIALSAGINIEEVS